MHRLRGRVADDETLHARQLSLRRQEVALGQVPGIDHMKEISRGTRHEPLAALHGFDIGIKAGAELAFAIDPNRLDHGQVHVVLSGDGDRFLCGERLAFAIPV